MAAQISGGGAGGAGRGAEAVAGISAGPGSGIKIVSGPGGALGGSGWFRAPDGSRLSTASSRIDAKFEHLNRSSMAPPLSGF